MKIVCFSDTHSFHRQVEVPPGDILIFAGDMTANGEEAAVIDFNQWLGTLPHPHKIVIAGNHDEGFQQQTQHYESLLTNAVYLNNTKVTVDGLTIWGSPFSPISPAFGIQGVYMVKRGPTIRHYWDQIPDNTDIVVTHCPPYGLLDQNEVGSKEGCKDLLNTVQRRVHPRVHIFGHIHSGYGQVVLHNTVYVNASVVTVGGKLATSVLGKLMYKLASTLYVFRLLHVARRRLKLSKSNRASLYLTVTNPPIVVTI